MMHTRELILWAVGGILGILLLIWGSGRLFPLLPEDWTLTRAQAEAVALARLVEIGEPAPDSYVVTRLRSDVQLERRLQTMAPQVGEAKIRASLLAKRQLFWEVQVFPAGARAAEWSHVAWVSRDGEVLRLRRRSAFPDADGANRLEDAELRRLAEQQLQQQGYELQDFDAEPAVNRGVGQNRERTVVRFRLLEQVLGDAYPYGLEVYFRGEEISGFGTWFEDPRRAALQGVSGQNQLLQLVRIGIIFLLLPLVAIVFLRLYHEGVLGVRRGVQIFLFSLVAGLLYLLLNADVMSVNTDIGLITRRQMTWVVAGFAWFFQYSGHALLGLMSWSVGEALCRRHWPEKLASIDALFRLRWRNATVAAAALQGLAGGLLMTGLLLTLGALGQRFGAWPMSAFFYTGALDGFLPGWDRLLLGFTMILPLLLFTVLLVPSWAMARFGTWGGGVLTVLALVLVVPMLFVLPLSWAYTCWLLVAPIPAILFRRADALAALLAPFTTFVLLTVVQLLKAGSPTLQVHGWLTLGVLFSPLLLSLRHLASGERFHYRYDDVPPHVRRIAERERQRMELETARNIQHAILPDLPPLLQGVELAHTYVPASEVGGDFYDVLPLEDGRLAVAVGDVAGHGVSSGLVMSMAKAALAVQVSFDADVAAVFRTLNRLVYRSARQRLLCTLLYAVVDTRRGTLTYASAGHVFPYHVSPNGNIEVLESIAYPLGVRPEMRVQVQTQRIAAGDSLFLCSDGLIEACPEGCDEPFGFDRLESSLQQHAGLRPDALRDAVMADVESYAGQRPQHDDLTILVLRLPEQVAAEEA